MLDRKEHFYRDLMTVITLITSDHQSLFSKQACFIPVTKALVLTILTVSHAPAMSWTNVILDVGGTEQNKTPGP